MSRYTPVHALALCWVPALAVSSTASAGAISEQVFVAAETAVEALPEQDGDAWARTRHGLLLRASLGDAWSLYASGEIHPALASEHDFSLDEADLRRLGLRYHGELFSVSAGRFVHLGSAGLRRVDGLGFDLQGELPLGLSLWGGRVGHVEALDLPGSMGGGLEAHGQLGPVGLGAGYELLRDIEALEHRAHASSTWRSDQGASVFALVEGGLRSAPATTDEPAEDTDTDTDTDTELIEDEPLEEPGPDMGLRAELASAVPLGTRATLRAGARWYGLAPAVQPWSSTTVLESIRPTDYGVADLSLELRPQRELRLRVSGGPTFYQQYTGWVVEPEDLEIDETLEADSDMGLGGTGKLAAEWNGLGLYGTSTAVGGSWYAGGGAGLQRSLGPVDMRAEAGMFRFHSLDDSSAWVGEGRLQGDLLLPAQPGWGELRLALRAAAGSDRLLSPWYRAGVALQGRLGNAGGAL